MDKSIRRRGRPKSVKLVQQPSGIQALNRALDVLEALVEHEGVTLTELADYLGQSAATMHRVLNTLEARHYVETDPKSQEWFIGAEAFRLGSAFLRHTNIVERSRSVMRELMAKTGETSNLGIESEGVVLFVSQVETHETIRAFIPPGTKSPLHASGIGKALLSTFDDEALGKFLKTAEFARFTSRTIVSAEDLAAEIRRTRQQGYSIDDEERATGMRCVAASIFNAYGEAVAGISISGPTTRMHEARIPQIGQWVAEAAREVSRRIGAQ